VKKSFGESKYEFFLFNDLLLYAQYVNYRFKLKKNFPIGRELEVLDLQDDPKRKNQFWIVAAEKTLLIQCQNPSEKEMWLNDLLHCTVPKKDKEAKKHEDLLARQRAEEEKSLRQREERKKVDPSAFSATEVPKDYVPDELKISRSPGYGKGSNFIQIPRPTSPTSSSSSAHSTLSAGSEPSSPVKTPTKSSSPDSPKSFLS